MAKLEIPTANVGLGLTVPSARGGRVSFDMKSPMGTALQKGSAELDDVLNLGFKLNERSAGLAAGSANAKFLLESSKIVQDVELNSSEDGHGIFDQVSEAIDIYLHDPKKGIRANLPSDRAREIFDSTADNTRSRALAGAYNTEAKKKAKFTKQSFLDVQNMYGQLLTTNPEELDLSIALLKDQIEIMGLTDTVAGELLREGQEHLSNMAVRGLIAQDPELAEKMIREGKFPHLKDKDQATGLRNADSQARSNKYQNSRIASEVTREISQAESQVVTHGLVMTDSQMTHLELRVRDIENPRDQKAARARVDALKAIRPLQANWHKMSIGALKKEIDNVYEPAAIEDGTTEQEALTLKAARQQLTLKNKTGGSDGKSLGKLATAALKRLNILGNTPGELSDAARQQVAEEVEFIKTHGTPGNIEDARKVVTNLDERNQIRGLTPVDLELRRDKLTARGGDLESTLRIRVLEKEIKLKEAARGKDGDPIGLLLRDQNNTREDFDPNDPLQMDLFILQGRRAATHVGLRHPNTFFRPGERAQLREQVNNLNVEQWVQMSRYFVENFEGKDFEVLIKDFGEVEPWFGHALSLASIGNYKLSSELFDAHRQLASKKTTGSFAAPPKTDTDSAIKTVVGNAFQGSGMELSVPLQITKMANVLYQTRHSGADYDSTLYEGIVHELVGGDPDDRDDTGIVDYNGAKMLLPSGVTGTTFERFIDRLTSEDFEVLGAYGDDDGIVVMSSGPMNDRGDEISPQQISDEGHFVNVGGNVYRIRMHDGNFASDENGDYYQVKIDADTIEVSGNTRPRPSNLSSPANEARKRALADRFRQKAFTGIDRLKAARDAARQNDKGNEHTTKRTQLMSVAHFVDATVEYEKAMRAHDIVTLNATVDIDDQDDAPEPPEPIVGPYGPVDEEEVYQDDDARPRGLLRPITSDKKTNTNMSAADDRESEFAVLGGGFKVEAIELNVGRGGAHATHAAAHSAAEILFNESERTLAHEFLVEIARQESNLGKAKNTFRKNGDRGIWQVNDGTKSGFEETKTAPSLEEDRKRIKALTGIDWSKLSADALDVPLISALAAALYVKRFNASIPQTLQGRAEAWKKFYNTAAGAGTETQYVANNIGSELG